MEKRTKAPRDPDPLWSEEGWGGAVFPDVVHSLGHAVCLDRIVSWKQVRVTLSIRKSSISFRDTDS